MAKLSFADGFDGFDGEIDRPCRLLLTTAAQTCRVVMFCVLCCKLSIPSVFPRCLACYVGQRFQDKIGLWAKLSYLFNVVENSGTDLTWLTHQKKSNLDACIGWTVLNWVWTSMVQFTPVERDSTTIEQCWVKLNSVETSLNLYQNKFDSVSKRVLWTTRKDLLPFRSTLNAHLGRQ